MRSPKQPTSPWIGQVLPAAIRSITDSESTTPLEVPTSQSAVVIMVDGLGWNLLHEYRGYAATLRSLLPDAYQLSTCLPSTTAAALTSFATGELPGATNMVGYSVRRGAGVMNLLNFADGVDPQAWQPVPTFFERLTGSDVEPVVITAPKFAGSGLTKAAFRGARFVGRLTLADRFRAARHVAEQTPSLVYVYWSEIDHAGHGHGPGSEQWLRQLEDFDRELGVFLRQPPKNTTIMLTGDHGMVMVEERVDIAEIPQLRGGVHLLAGEGRSVHVHAEPGEGAAVLERWADYFSGRAAVLGPEQFPEVIGAGAGNSLLGDALVFPSGRFVIVDSRHQTQSMMGQKGVHGSFTEEEVLVPLLVIAP